MFEVSESIQHIGVFEQSTSLKVVVPQYVLEWKKRKPVPLHTEQIQIKKYQIQI